MSTFSGVVVEFPDIRIDYFRPIRDRRPPRACFLSHVHTDHLNGLENKTFHGNFLYCSPATKEMLLRLKKYPQRLNFARGMLETTKVTYEHLKDRLKTIPLETPTCVELEPGNEIQVTLFDANHCTGAVMFLIEGNNKAILYTGDIRSEPWFVNSLTRNPFLLEYTSGLKKLNCIYLDTSNTHPTPFPTKADGLKELLQKVSKYPAETVFHFEAWTFGYEEVWMALSRALKSQIHVDNYKLGLYSSLRGKADGAKNTSDAQLSGPFLAHNGPVLTGFKCGNTPQPGCLTSDKSVRLHSCEKGMHCEHLKNRNTVWITPIITRNKHGEVAEVGVGGGGGDLNQRQLQLGLTSVQDIIKLVDIFAAKMEASVGTEIKTLLLAGLQSNQSAISLDGLDLEQGSLPLKKLTESLAEYVTEKRSASLSDSLAESLQSKKLPRTITFPYSRHSSYAELCDLVEVFGPKDVYPCTVDEANWDFDNSMDALFGHVCSDDARFRHDLEMRELHADRHLRYVSQQTQTTTTSDPSSQMRPPSSPAAIRTPKAKLQLHRDPLGRNRLFDAEGNEVLPQEFSTRLHETMSGDPAQVIRTHPPREIIARSPGSESQNLKRKAIDLGMGEDWAKRRQFDGLSSPTPAVASFIRPSTPAIFQHSNDEPIAPLDTPSHSSEADIWQQRRRAWSCGPGEELRYYYSQRDDAEKILWDIVDNVPRCKVCGHEIWGEIVDFEWMWGRKIGFCTGECGLGPDEIPYYEILDPEEGHIEVGPVPGQPIPNRPHPRGVFLRPRIIDDEYKSDSEQISDSEERRKLVGDYLEDHSDAYDTVDEDPSYLSEYDDEDPFIDDASIHASPEDDDDEESDGETNYKQLNVELQTKFDSLQGQYVNLRTEHDEFRREILGSAYYDSDDDDMEEMDEQGHLIVNVATQELNVVDLVLSQGEGQSQESHISPERVRDRISAFEAVDDGHGWQSISLISTGGNHTHPEIEL